MPSESPLSMMRPPDQARRQPAVRRTRRRRWPVFLAPVAIVFVLALAWVWLWYYAATVAGRTLTAWVEREAAADRVYACGSQSIGGFPFRIEARCADAAAEIKSTQLPYSVKTSAVSFAAEVWHPTRLVGDISGPLTLAEAGQPVNWIANWRRARLTVSGLPPDPEGISVRLDGAHVDRAAGGDAVFKAKNAELQGRITGGSPRDHPVLQVMLHLAGTTAPALHPLLAAPIDADVEAVVRGLKDLSPKPWAERLREMQGVDGGIEIKSLRIAQTDIIVVGSGTLSVNAHGKLDGLVRVAIVGIEHLVPLLGADRIIGQEIDQLAGSKGTAAQGAAVLDRLIPGLAGALREGANASVVENLKKMGETSSIDKQPAIVLPLRFADGSIYLGMLRVGEMPPLF
jgi:hypothetical protein